jgi:hypothetical protein
MVYVYEQVSGTLVTLTGSDEPFETSEDDSDDIFTPIRHQTGYLRVVDETANGNLMETMMPINNTEKMVCLYTGTWDADFTTFTDGSLKWQGFLCAELLFLFSETCKEARRIGFLNIARFLLPPQ